MHPETILPTMISRRVKLDQRRPYSSKMIQNQGFLSREIVMNLNSNLVYRSNPISTHIIINQTIIQLYIRARLPMDLTC